MAKPAAIRVLEASGCDFSLREYKYVERGGTRASSEALGVSEHRIIKTLIFETDQKAPLIVLMHGDRQVSTKALGRIVGSKKISPCTPTTAQKHSGYMVGGTSPFGTRRVMPVYMQESVVDLPCIYINAGMRGSLVQMAPADLVAILRPRAVDVAT